MADATSVVISLEATKVASGGSLRGSFMVTSRGPVSRLELSVLWLTSGRGHRDEQVILFRDVTAEASSPGSVPFEVRIPLSPTTYAGECLSIQWLVRVTDGATAVWDAPFEVLPGG